MTDLRMELDVASPRAQAQAFEVMQELMDEGFSVDGLHVPIEKRAIEYEAIEAVRITLEITVYAVALATPVWRKARVWLKRRKGNAPRRVVIYGPNGEVLREGESERDDDG